MALFFVDNSVWIGKVEFVHPDKKYAIARTLFGSKKCTTCLLPASASFWQSSVPRNIGPLYVSTSFPKADWIKDDVVVVDMEDLSQGKNGYFATSFLHPSWSKSVAKFFEACKKPLWARLKYDNIGHRQELRKELTVMIKDFACDVLFHCVACYIVRDFSMITDMLLQQPSETCTSISAMSEHMPRLRDESQFICDLAYFTQDPNMITELKDALNEHSKHALSAQGQAFVDNADKYHRRLTRLLAQS
jgi:hypothetical protein